MPQGYFPVLLITFKSFLVLRGGTFLSCQKGGTWNIPSSGGFFYPCPPPPPLLLQFLSKNQAEYVLLVVLELLTAPCLLVMCAIKRRGMEVLLSIAGENSAN